MCLFRVFHCMLWGWSFWIKNHSGVISRELAGQVKKISVYIVCESGCYSAEFDFCLSKSTESLALNIWSLPTSNPPPNHLRIMNALKGSKAFALVHIVILQFTQWPLVDPGSTDVHWLQGHLSPISNSLSPPLVLKGNFSFWKLSL